jgi:16S rRNA (guanine527-N7)-methyltransferase
VTVDLQSMVGMSVSRETMIRLEVIAEQLKKWQPRINLVANGTIEALWSRHIRDSLQLSRLEHCAKRWIDLGSGGGFPGLVVAADRADDPEFRMVLVESNGKKCAFLRETARLAGLPVEVIHGRAEIVIPVLPVVFDVVSARALAPLADLLEYANPLIAKGAVGIFPKGQGVDDEVSAANATWKLKLDLIQSQTEPNASVVVIRSALRRVPNPVG